MALDPLEYWRRPPRSRPWILGHRGLCTHAPENTLGAFEAAVVAGADGVELDVRLSRDGQVVVIHDHTLTRITLGSRTELVGELSAAELGAVLLPAGERLSTLAEVLVWADHHECRVNVELKHEGDDPTRLVRAVADVVGSSQHPERLLFSSFDTATVCELARTLDNAAIAWLTESASDLGQPEDELRMLQVRALHPKHVVLNADVMQALRQRFALINTWTVNQPERVVLLANLGVDTIITDNPVGAFGAFAEAGQGA